MLINAINILSKLQGSKINYQKILDHMIKLWEEKKFRPRILLHSCCGPCSTYVIEFLSNHAELSVYYINPNIHPEEEFRYRMVSQKKFIEEFNKKNGNTVHFIEGDYRPALFFKCTEGMENEPEGGKRCALCFRLRMELCAEKAIENNFDYFATTLTVSPKKNSNLINEIGLDIQKRTGMLYLPSDFKKNGGYQQSILLSKEYHLYRQHFCGCKYAFEKQGLNEESIRKNAIEGIKNL